MEDIHNSWLYCFTKICETKCCVYLQCMINWNFVNNKIFATTQRPLVSELYAHVKIEQTLLHFSQCYKK